MNEFHYPERGPGQMWETLADRLRARNYPVLTDHRVVQNPPPERETDRADNRRA